MQWEAYSNQQQMGARGCERNEFRFLGGGIGMCWGRSTICSMAGRDRRAFLNERVARCVPCSSPSVRGVFSFGFGSSATGPSASKSKHVREKSRFGFLRGGDS